MKVFALEDKIPLSVDTRWLDVTQDHGHQDNRKY